MPTARVGAMPHYSQEGNDASEGTMKKKSKDRRKKGITMEVSNFIKQGLRITSPIQYRTPIFLFGFQSLKRVSVAYANSKKLNVLHGRKALIRFTHVPFVPNPKPFCLFTLFLYCRI